jgi:entericidin B
MKENFMKKLMILSALFASIFALSACNTVSGVGKDVQDAGKTIENVGK